MSQGSRKFRDVRKSRPKPVQTTKKLAAKALFSIAGTSDGAAIADWLHSIVADTGGSFDPSSMVEELTKRRFASEILSMMEPPDEPLSDNNQPVSSRK